MRYLIIIPARGGSKGIHRKNVVNVNGAPLISFSINVALQVSDKIESVHSIVSTDDKEIQAISAQYGINSPFLRPSNISGDKAQSIEFILHAIKFFEKNGDAPENIIVLQPTSPLRSVDDVLDSIRLFETNTADSLISAYREETINESILYKENGDFADPIVQNHNVGIRRQDHGALLVRNGAIYIASTKFLCAQCKIISDKPLVYIMPKSHSINIDNNEDLEVLRMMVKTSCDDR